MSLAVVGGFYEEHCAEPHWRETFGSGGRAAAAISGRKAAVELFTYCPPDWIKGLQFFSGSFGFSVTPAPSPSGVTFEYLHWLRCPKIYPRRSEFSGLPPIKVADREAILRFGLYEGDAVVAGKHVVYDPQNGKESTLFAQNGSKAEHLAIVCNYVEGCAMAGEKEPGKIISQLLSVADAVVLKMGWSGAIAATRCAQELIRPIPTKHVHKIGSGDVFSAEFAYLWAASGVDPIDSARAANEKVAYYCENGSLPIPLEVSVSPSLVPLVLSSEKRTYDVYLAGPFFNANQLSMVEEILFLLSEGGLRVFSPYHNVGLGETMKIAAQDLAGLHASRFVFACLDGYDPGTVFEAGYARALGIPVIVYSPNLDKLHETMFVGTQCEIISDFTTAIYRAFWWANHK